MDVLSIDDKLNFDGTATLTVKFNPTEQLSDSIARLASKIMNNGLLTVELKEKRKGRSLKANAYCWVLCDEIAKELRSTKELVYRNTIRNVGLWDPMTLEAKNYDSINEIWGMNGIGWFLEPYEYNGDTLEVHAYRGTSGYTTSEMSIIIEELVNQAKELGIETKSPEELKYRLKENEYE